MTVRKKPPEGCSNHISCVQEAMAVLNGKWKISIIAVLCFHQKRRFSNILYDIGGISNKMLSKELKEMESQQLVKRTVLNTQPVSVEYELTEYGSKLQEVILTLANWGEQHREKMNTH